MQAAATAATSSILWTRNPQDIIARLPLKVPDYQGTLQARAHNALDDCLLYDPSIKGDRARQAEYELCKADILHFIRMWCWLWNPQRPEDDQEIPYVPYEFQEELILYLRDAIVRCNDPMTPERENIIIDKCREMAGSWTVYAVILHDFLFHKGSFLILSWKFDEVDQAQNMDTPFEKLRFLLRRLPDFLKPGWDWDKHDNVGNLKHPRGSASISAESVVAAAGAGGRRKAIIWDEMGKIKDGRDFTSWRSLSGTSRLRIGISTPEGKDNQFGRLATGIDKDVARTLISLNWWKDPVKTKDAKPCPKDKRHPDGITSSWYEAQVATFNQQELASQVNINYEESQVAGIFTEQYSVWHQAENLQPIPGREIIVCIDPGVHMFASVVQFDHYDRYLILDEHYDPKAHIDVFVEEIQRKLRDRFKGFKVKFIGDPAGGTINSSMHKLKSEYAYMMQQFSIVVEYNFQSPNTAEWVPNRIRAMRGMLQRVCSQLTSQYAPPAPMVLVDVKNCPFIHAALSGGYQFVVRLDGTITSEIKAIHPSEDAADCATYPLIYRGMYKQKDERRDRDRDAARRRSPEWKEPGDITYYA
jgi:hypothetical protein